MRILLDTCYLREAGSDFNHPDLQKLLLLSRKGELMIFIPHIAWEERRTQIVDTAKESLEKLHTAMAGVERQLAKSIVLKGLSHPMLTVWNEDNIQENSVISMSRFADENKIIIIPIADDHGERAWARYFDIRSPFNPDEKRENRRKDIPDSWILEAAIDVEDKHPGLMALCGDDKLSGALSEVGVEVFKTAQEVLDEIELRISVQPDEVEQVEVVDATDSSLDEDEETKIHHALSSAQVGFEDLDIKVLGYVVTLDGGRKEEIFDLLEKSGIQIDMAKNVAERLVLSGLINDTGNHYLAKNNEVSNLAAASVENEFINLLGES